MNYISQMLHQMAYDFWSALAHQREAELQRDVTEFLSGPLSLKIGGTADLKFFHVLIKYNKIFFDGNT